MCSLINQTTSKNLSFYLFYTVAAAASFISSKARNPGAGMMSSVAMICSKRSATKYPVIKDISSLKCKQKRIIYKLTPKL